MDEAPVRGRRANAMATVALLAWLVALVLPWWTVANRTAGGVWTFGPWQAGSVDLRAPWVWASAALAVAAAGLLFVRVAANSIRHEPRAWRRDVALAAAGMAASLALTSAWPDQLPFWGERAFTADGAGGGDILAGAPGLGWWIGVGAVALVAGALLSAGRPATEK